MISATHEGHVLIKNLGISHQFQIIGSGDHAIQPLHGKVFSWFVPHMVCISILPFETYTPLFIDADAY